MSRYIIACAAILLGFAGCDRWGNTPFWERRQTTAPDDAPAWAAEAVWYQIFVERFNNGDPANDPTPESLDGAYPFFVPTGWQVTPWTHDWYQPDPYFAALDTATLPGGSRMTSFEQKVQLRRYGGDLQGVIDKLDYLADLGINAIYFNPLNDAPSMHKYDPRSWHHIDVNFGPDPAGDRRRMATEDPGDPETWVVTSADSLFLHLIDELHRRDIRLIMDYSWNHTGMKFWALDDVRQQGILSPYADWYWVKAFDDPATPANEFDYRGWYGLASLPEIRETVEHETYTKVQAYEGDLYSESVKQHIFAVSRRWLDPDGDGDPSDGVDGFRLDVAGELPLGFWREYRKEVRSTNPNAYLIGEIWWEEWPDKLLDPAPFLQGDAFDAVMNYRWYRSARHFFNAAPDSIAVSELVDSLQRYAANLRPTNQYAMMNLTASHDVPRVGTSLFNKNKYKVGTQPAPDNDYRIHRPDSATYQTLRLLLAQQFTFVGAPHIWAGDEMGMWGADDPSTRKPLIWPDLKFEPERTHPLGRTRPVDAVAFNRPLFQYYQQLIRLRKAHPVLMTGALEYVLIDDARQLLGYRRYDDKREAIALFNASNSPQAVALPNPASRTYSDALGGLPVSAAADSIHITLPARSAAVLIKK